MTGWAGPYIPIATENVTLVTYLSEHLEWIVNWDKLYYKILRHQLLGMEFLLAVNRVRPGLKTWSDMHNATKALSPAMHLTTRQWAWGNKILGSLHAT